MTQLDYGPPTSTPAQLRAVGTSASGTPNTVIATISAAAGKKLVGVQAFGGQTNAAGTQVSIRITYTDATVETLITTTAASTDIVQAIQAGGWRGGSAFQAFSTTKDIKTAEVITTGTGTGTRTGFVAALEISA